MMVTAVIVNYYTASILPSLLDGLFGDPLVENGVVVDNSGDVPADITLAYPRLQLIRNSENRGFGAAVNLAVGRATGKWLLVINPDVRLTGGCLEALMNVGEKYGCPILGPRFYWDRNFQFRLPPATGDCLWMHAANNAADHFKLDGEILSFYWVLRHQRFWEAMEPFFEPFLTGACLLLNREWIESQGGRVFDERFFLYFEDTDLCVRAMDKGIRPLCVPQATAIHYWDQSPSPENRKIDLMQNAQEHFVRKYYGEYRFPLLKCDSHASHIMDLGTSKTPPEFMIDGKVGEEPLYFEIAVNPYFVPFAQAPLKARKFAFPSEIWSRLGQGTYYSRVRGPVSGSLGVWKWGR